MEEICDYVEGSFEKLMLQGLLIDVEWIVETGQSKLIVSSDV